MAIDPRISMHVQQASVAPAINTFMGIREQQRQMQFDPLRMQQMELGNQQTELGNQFTQEQIAQVQQAQEATVKQQNISNAAQFYQSHEDLFTQGNPDAIKQAVKFSQLIPDDGKQEIIQAIDSGNLGLVEQSFRGASEFVSQRQNGGIPAGIRERDRLLNDLNSNDPNVRKSAEIDLGLKPRAVGSATQTITDTGNVDDVADTEKTLAEGKRTGTLSADLKLRPEIESKVKERVAQVTAEADRKVKQATDERAFSTYQAAMDGVTESLTGTDTGYFSGLLPAISTNQQVADGAIAAMAPVLKQLFRGSGEGTFTDKDQELLINMVPTRRDNAEAIAQKVKTIDMIVRSKLGIPAPQAQQPNQPLLNPELPSTDPNSQMDNPDLQPQQPTQTQEGARAVNPQTGQVAIFTNGQWVIQNG